MVVVVVVVVAVAVELAQVVAGRVEADEAKQVGGGLASHRGPFGPSVDGGHRPSLSLAATGFRWGRARRRAVGRLAGSICLTA